jgi:hypothetical protein
VLENMISLSDRPESLKCGEQPLLSYLILLPVEFTCFHSSSSLRASRSRQSEIIALDILSVALFLEYALSRGIPGRPLQPLRRSMKPGLSSREFPVVVGPSRAMFRLTLPGVIGDF